jgi:hypothetical protein
MVTMLISPARLFDRLTLPYQPMVVHYRQALKLIQPVGEAIKQQEKERQQEIFKQAGEARSQHTSTHERKRPAIRRLYVEIDGVLARLRRGSVPMEQKERKREGRCVSRSESRGRAIAS